MTEPGTLNFLWSQQLVAGFVAAGVRHAVISPGSRSTPLALALLRQPRIACEMVIDERCAAFFALGIAKATRAPVLLLATSGSAPANWLPAVVEASQAGVPLLLVSADRPAELHGCGANQTIDQLALFGPHVRARHALDAPHEGFAPARLHALAAQACAQARGPLPGPVHLNQPFREPLVPASDCPPVEVPPLLRGVAPDGVPDAVAVRELARRIAGRPGAIVCGELPASPGFAEALTALAAQLDCPVLAEPLSGLRFGRHDRSQLCVRYDDWLPTAPTGEWLLRFGAFPVTKTLQQYVARARAVHALVDPWPRWNDPVHRLTDLLHADPVAFCRAMLAERPASVEPAWRAVLAEREMAAADLANSPDNPIAALIAALPEGMPLFVGNSLAVRDLDRASGSADKHLPIYANRGVSGIDGNLSTALGIAAVTGRVVALVGDLTCQHDIGGLALAAGRDAVIVVVNNGGGGIFELLPQRALPEFERGWKMPQDIDFSHAAQTFGITFLRVDSPEELHAVLTRAFAAGGPHLIELRQ
ncbi:MAG: 2-succinyl-5-enolpyruvyl-6-hydroxy-3-cyclohexene-1-carboxylic-acid synthase [Azonexus sp.]|jgi:2-succinyl-5-enolpyruvyl-6-hydroxy-3-cyclohexene-1-carboxylate synthase|uniref:2-succinyl-5-enolpyruvyl-6-hydroxy-3- cyclohexene-1-carboxylic-acid synthase n=1 Tax=Azonexus sp. TaxID=1872668 RepID=UPI0028236A6C|nr:2-succinyl-5-enolpyruvyl-6-hydroxy-3-cyclohexene-1-carboxylic-acid synthase [Azonexus sp.]MDR0775235.1 2-succinyl-5-enolpyruvyl-6-hydroxy-3-cyclohexene-1-carboxylic-acid synthase [Azonexus sp.]